MPLETKGRAATVAACLAAISIAALSWSALGDDPRAEIEASFEPGAARLGEAAVLIVDARVPSGYHTYSMTRIPDGPMRLRIDVEAEGLEPIGDWHGPAPAIEMDEGFGRAVEIHTGRVTHRRAFRAVSGSGEIRMRAVVRGQICDERRCVPFEAPIEAALSIEPGDARPDRTGAPDLPGEAFPEDRPPPSGEGAGRGLPLQGGLLGFLAIAFLAGLGALVTPCVFPMIPITVSFFSKFASVSIRRSLTMGLIYAVSIIATFTLVGVLVSGIFGAVGMQVLSASPWFNLFLTALLVFFALNLFGLFEIRMPGWLVARTSRKERDLTSDDGSLTRQAGGVFFMAITFTLVSFTCTVGFIGIVLAEAARGNWFYPAVGMLAFSLAFSLPFFLLAVFPSWADKLRGRGGDWMVAVKVVLGFLELAGAFKFLSNADLVWKWGVVTRPLVLAIWAAIFIAAGLYLLRIFGLPNDDREARTVGPIRMIFAIGALALAAHSAGGVRDTESMGGWLDGWLPPAVYPGQEASAGDAEHLPWIVDDIDKGMRRAAEESKPLFVDFTGYTCTNCRYMEGSVFPRPEVRSRLERMVLVTAYTDGTEEVHEKQRRYQIERFGTAALPLYAIIDPRDGVLLAVHPDMTKNVGEYVAFLDSGLAAFERAAREAGPPARSAADAGTGSGPDGGTGAVPVDLAPAGDPVDLRFPRLDDGRPFALSSTRGGWVLLNLWASWCAPCKKELKKDFPLALSRAPHVRLVTIAFDGEETKKAAASFAKEVGLFEHTVLLGGEDVEESGLDEAFGADNGLPITYLIHPNGHIAWMRKGSIDAALLDRLLGKTAHPGRPTDVLP